MTNRPGSGLVAGFARFCAVQACAESGMQIGAFTPAVGAPPTYPIILPDGDRLSAYHAIGADSPYAR